MNLLWHIVAKDVRRMWLPTALWLAFVGGSALYFAMRPGVDPLGYDAWITVTNSLALVVSGAQFFIGFVLTGVLVLEDPVMGTDSFWPTRPVSRPRLLAAKAVTAALLFVIAPALALVPAWGIAGFSASEMTSAAQEAMLKHAHVTAFALGMGGLAATLAQFLFGALAVAVLHMLCGAAVMTILTPQETALSVRHARNFLIQSLVLPAFAGLAVHQYLTRSRKRGWIIVGCLLAVTALIRNVWPWSLEALTSRPLPLDASSVKRQEISERALKIAHGSPQPESEIRIREGATLAMGSNLVKLIQISRGADGAPTSLTLEEHDAWPWQYGGWAADNRTSQSAIRADRYFLRTGQGVQLLEKRQGPRAVHSSLSIAVTWVMLPSGTTDEMLGNATLLKVRYEKE